MSSSTRRGTGQDRHRSLPISLAGKTCPALLGILLIALLASIDLPAQTPAQRRPHVLTAAGKAHDLRLPPAPGTGVHFIGTITYYDQANRVMFLQDASGGIYIDTDKPYPVHEGDLVEVDGQADHTYRTQVGLDPSIRVLGRGQAPHAPSHTFQELVAGREDSKLVSIRGRVRAADVGYHASAPAVHMDVVMPGGEVEIYVTDPVGFHPESMLDATVEITGVAGGSFDTKWQLTGVILYVQDPSDIRVVHAPAMNAAELPLTDIDDVFESRSVLDTSRRVRVRGTVTYYQKGYAAVLQSGGKSIYVQTRQTKDIAVGDVADALGFASGSGYAPSLREAAILPTGRRENIVPQTVTYAQALSGAFSDNLIALSGQLISELHDVGTDTVVLEVDGHLVSAYLEGSAPLQDFLLGSRIRIAGVCRILPGNPWQAPYVFHVDMRDATDARLISKPPWWTIRHLAELLGALVLLASAISTWAIVLRRQVLGQTERIQRSMTVARERSRILEKISSNQMPETVLSEICRSVMLLLPKCECTYSLKSDLEKPDSALDAQGASGTSEIFELELKGPEDQTLGRIAVSAPSSQFFALDQQQEVYAILTELATLAIHQSLLYEGLLHHSTHDPLTELPNRRLCDSKFGEALEEARSKGSRVAVIYIDINRFKEVNDKYGHKVGDSYLRQISARLLLHIRPTDTLARIGGDEFLIISPFATSFDQTEAIAARLRACFDEPFLVEGHSIAGSASFGIARYPENGASAEALKRNADHAMYLAKRQAACASDASIDLAIVTPEELAVAVGKDQLCLVYQPQFSASGRMTGVEALLRLDDPILGILSPDAFIAVAERSDVVVEIGAWVLRKALQDAVRWGLHTGEKVVVAVNVSVRQLTHPGFAAFVTACLEEHAFPAERLELELVERSLLSGGKEVTRQIEKIHQAGVRLSIDDFGTGQSCLSMLHKLPVDTIKLDRSFIFALESEPAVRPVIQAICSIARSLGKRIVAEGIEHAEAIPTLLEMGEMEFQGYLLSRPMPTKQVDHLIHSWRSGIVMPFSCELVPKHRASEGDTLQLPG